MDSNTIPAVGSIDYCANCREAIIVETTSHGRVWAHRNSGQMVCEIHPSGFSTACPGGHVKGDADILATVDRIGRDAYRALIDFHAGRLTREACAEILITCGSNLTDAGIDVIGR